MNMIASDQDNRLTWRTLNAFLDKTIEDLEHLKPGLVRTPYDKTTGRWDDASLQHENENVHGPQIELHVGLDPVLFGEGLGWKGTIRPFQLHNWRIPTDSLKQLISKSKSNFSNVHF